MNSAVEATTAAAVPTARKAPYTKRRKKASSATAARVFEHDHRADGGEGRVSATKDAGHAEGGDADAEHGQG